MASVSCWRRLKIKSLQYFIVLGLVLSFGTITEAIYKLLTALLKEMFYLADNSGFSMVLESSSYFSWLLLFAKNKKWLRNTTLYFAHTHRIL